MKLSLILSMVLGVISAQANGQKEGTFSLKLENVSIENVFREIEKSSNYRFIYQVDDLKGLNQISIDLKDADINNVLTECLKGSQLESLIENEYIIIRKSMEVKTIKAIEVSLINIKGKVLDKDGISLPGATVLEEGTSNGVITDQNGNFSLKVTGSASVLKVSFIGFETQFIEVGDKTEFSIVLNPSATSLNEVIVVGYGTKGKNEITGSTVQVSGAQLAQIPVASVDQALQGKVAGLTISATSGTPGSFQDIRIRGMGSLTAGNDPLFVIDGVPMISGSVSNVGTTSWGTSVRSSLTSLASLNSADIESITILKDASATSAYGARGSNGVIVITTKKGKSGKTQFDFSASHGFQNDATKGRLALNGAQREELLLEAIYNTYGQANGFSEAEAYSYVVAKNKDNRTLQNWVNAGRPFADWNEAVDSKNAPVQNVSLSATGGDDLQSFYASFSYNKTEATVIGNDFKRVTGVLSYGRKFRNNLTFSTRANVSNNHQTGFLEGGRQFANPRAAAFFMSPWITPYDEDGNINISYKGSVYYNYLYLAKHDITYNDLTRAISNSNIEWEIVKNLKFKSRISLDYAISEYKVYRNRIHGDGKALNGSSSDQIERNFNYVAQNSLDYLMVYKENHRISVTALLEYQKNKQNRLTGYGENFPADGLTNIDNAGSNYQAGSSFYDWSNLSYLGMVNYNYLGRYIADFTIRREGSSRFEAANRYGTFWAAGAAWNMSQEKFLSDIDWISNLRVRASYGLSGSSAIGINGYQASLAYDANYIGNGAIYTNQYGNSELTWEKNKNSDIGIDFGFFDNAISGSFAYFHKKTYDLLQNVPLSRSTGHSSYTENVGAMVNKGIEFIVAFDILKSKDLNINASFNFATLDNEVTELAYDGNGVEISISNSIDKNKSSVGHTAYEWYMIKWAGVDPANGLPLWYVNGVDGETTSNYSIAAQAWQGKGPLPTYSGGMSLHVDYKNFFVDANASFQGGNAIYEMWTNLYMVNGTQALLSFNGAAELMNRWQNPGDITDIPKMVWSSDGNKSANTSTRFLYDGDYMRLKDLVFGYDFSKSILSKLKINGLKVYVRGTNLLIWVKDKRLKYDPEVGADGFTGLETPPVKSIVFGLNLKF